MKKKRIWMGCIVIFLALTVCIVLEQRYSHSYGVFLSLDNSAENLEQMADYQTIVLDASYFSAEDIGKLKENGNTVLSYLNVGALENFRSYYDEYSYLKLGDYENWDEEIWMDVSNAEYQSFLVDTLAEEYAQKGVDGYFIDNCDVYYFIGEERPEEKEKLYQGLDTILKQLVDSGKQVVINGGDSYVWEHAERNEGVVSDILTGINQETVFTAIDFDHNSFGTAEKEDHIYFKDYIESFADQADIYLLEYTKNPFWGWQAELYGVTHGYSVYVSDSIELD